MSETTKVWAEYLHDFNSFTNSLEFEINQANYKEIIIEFDTFFFKKGFEYGIYNFYPIETIQKRGIDELIEGYMQDFTTRLSMPKHENIALLDLWKWKRIKEEKLMNTGSIMIPVLQENEWVLHEQETNGTHHLFEWYSSIPHSENMPFDEFISTMEDKDAVWTTNIYVALMSNSNIWFDEIDITAFEGKHGYTEFDPPKDNRAIAYRITPRFNSFWRDIKIKAIEMGGKINVDTYPINVSTEGYMLLDGMIIFQEDIESGLIKLPD